MPGIPFPDIDPIALQIGPLAIRWYALAYLAGFLGGWYYALRLAAADADLRPVPDDIDNFMPWAVLGVILGGRLGYVLFYNLEYYILNPFSIPFIWEGGMSFHGGALGVILAMIGYAYRHKFSPFLLADIVVCVVPIGLFFGRLANFVNGELFGRVTTVPWGVVFPYGGDLPRHPSQFYEAILEGLVLFTILGVMAMRPKIRRTPGVLGGTFLAGYGISRFIVEFFREPDAHIGFLFQYFSMGQLLSMPMALIGVGMILYARKRGLPDAWLTEEDTQTTTGTDDENGNAERAATDNG